MGATCTIATHNGSAAHREHNVRNEKVVSKEAHIQENGRYEIWKDETPRQAYHRLFDEAVERYNAKQTRQDRKINNYYSQIEKDAKKHPVYEMIIGVYPEKGKFLDTDMQREILKDFVDDWQNRNPSLEMIGAYFHADEEGEPHCHIDYIPVATGYTKGMDTQTGLVKALEQQGFIKNGRETAQIQWERRENECLEKLCKERGLEVQHPVKSKEHLHTELYKAQKGLDTAIEHTRDLLTIQDDLRAKTSKLEAIRDKAEKQSQKAIERKTRAFSRSWKKDKESGWSYDRGLEKEIKALVKDRAEDVKAISHTDLDVLRQYDIAEQHRLQAEREASRKKAQAKEELSKAQEYKEQMESYIRGTAEKEARRLFQQFIDREFSGKIRGSEARLREHCANIKYTDGHSVLEDFDKAEKALRQRLERSWDLEQ